MSQRWFITGASRGLGLEIAKAALAVGHRVVATSRSKNTADPIAADSSERFLALALDITRPEEVSKAVDSAVAHFGGIDVLVNNAGYGQLGFFEENTLQDALEQLETNLLGTLNVAWAVLPVMRAAREGRIFNVSSVAGIRGSMTGSIYSASKFGVEGFSEALSPEVEPLGVHVTIVEPGLFKTDFLSPSSVRFGGQTIADYAEQSAKLQELYRGLNRQQKGDPQKLAEAIVSLAKEPNPPLRFAAGVDAVAAIEEKIAKLRLDLDQWKDLSVSTGE